MSQVTILSMADTGVAIDRVCKGARDNEALIHQLAVSTLDHAREHGNTTGISRLLNGLPVGVRVKGLAEWYKGFSTKKLNPVLDAKTKMWRVELATDRLDEHFKIAASMEVTFAEFTAEPNYKTLDLAAFLKGIKRTAMNTGNHPGTDIPKVSSDTRAVALKLYNFIQSEAKSAMVS